MKGSTDTGSASQQAQLTVLRPHLQSTVNTDWDSQLSQDWEFRCCFGAGPYGAGNWSPPRRGLHK